MYCNSEITEFDVEKIDFDTSRIILLCDVSGSMSGSVGALKDAITRFADEMNENEKISVIGFDDSINFERDFSSDPQKNRIVCGRYRSIRRNGYVQRT